MSRSRRKTPIFGYTSSDSERQDKQIWHRRWRHNERQALATADDFDAHLTLLRDDVSSTWNMDKDGKHYWPAEQQAQAAEWTAARKGRSPQERAAIKKRILRKWMAK